MQTVGVLGATSMVGQSLLPQLVVAGFQVKAVSRKAQRHEDSLSISWLTTAEFRDYEEVIADWVCLAPIWVLPDYFPMLTRCRAKRVVALSSTSVFTKQNSSDPAEQEIATRLIDSERHFVAWAEANQIEWVILRPTLIYGLGRDRNISEIARLISRFGFFPLLGSAQGLRQPVHVEDVASACAAALHNTQANNHAYNLSGAERLAYREMVGRVFRTMGRPERFMEIPLWMFRAAIMCLKILPKFRKWSPAMAERMSADLVF